MNTSAATSESALFPLMNATTSRPVRPGSGPGLGPRPTGPVPPRRPLPRSFLCLGSAVASVAPLGSRWVHVNRGTPARAKMDWSSAQHSPATSRSTTHG